MEAPAPAFLPVSGEGLTAQLPCQLLSSASILPQTCAPLKTFPNHNLPPAAFQLFLNPASVPLHPLLRSTCQSGCWSNHPDCTARQPRHPQDFLAVGNADCVTLAAHAGCAPLNPQGSRGGQAAFHLPPLTSADSPAVWLSRAPSQLPGQAVLISRQHLVVPL